MIGPVIEAVFEIFLPAEFILANPLCLAAVKEAEYIMEKLTFEESAAALKPETIDAVGRNLPQILGAASESQERGIAMVTNLVKSIWGDPCKRGCDFRHAFNKSLRQSCKAQCEAFDRIESENAYKYAQALAREQGYDMADWKGAGLFGNIGTNEILLGAGLIAAYFYLQND